MLKVTVIHVGNLKESYYREAVGEYAKRLSAYCKYSSVEIKESPLPESPSRSEIEKALEKEADMIISAIPKKAYTVALCVEGRMLSSEELAALVQRVPEEGCDSLIFIIGSSYGLSPRIKSLADQRISFSKMTFPHRLMRVMLAEQIYRAFTICEGKHYHK